MRKNNFIKKIFMVLIAITIFSTSFIGYSSFFIETNFSYSNNYKMSEQTSEPIAYNSVTKKEYTLLDRAIEDALANETIFVIPGSRITLSKPCTIKENVTLCLPFENETRNGRQENAENTNTWRRDIYQDLRQENFADGNETLVQKYLKTQITINPAVTLTNRGNIQIGGVLGIEAQKLAGATSGYYCEMLFSDGARLNNYGTIKCMGYLKETSKNNDSQIINFRGSTFECPMVFYDYKGGGYTASVYGNEKSKIFPCNQYDFPNNQIHTTFQYGSIFNGYVDLYTNETSKSTTVTIIFFDIEVTVTIHARHNVDDLQIIGTSNSLFELSENSLLTIKYTPISDQRYTTYSNSGSNRTGSNGLTTIKLQGEINFSSFTLSIQAAQDTEIIANGSADLSFLKGIIEQYLNQEINTDTIDFPIPWNMSINIENGVFNINDRVKFLGGSSLYASKNSTINVNNKLIFYDDSITSLYSDTSYAGSIYPYEKGPANLTIDGILNINDNGSFGGKISSSSAEATINVSSNATLSAESHEGSGDYSISGTSINFTFSDYNGSPIQKKSNVDLLNTENNTISNSSVLEQNSTYKSIIFENQILWQKI